MHSGNVALRRGYHFLYRSAVRMDKRLGCSVARAARTCATHSLLSFFFIILFYFFANTYAVLRCVAGATSPIAAQYGWASGWDVPWLAQRTPARVNPGERNMFQIAFYGERIFLYGGSTKLSPLVGCKFSLFSPRFFPPPLFFLHPFPFFLLFFVLYPPFPLPISSLPPLLVPTIIYIPKKILVR